MSFAKSIRVAREQVYKSPREFHMAAKLSCSYYQYLKVENGSVLPNVKLATEIIEALKLDRKQLILSWLNEQVPDFVDKAFSKEYRSNKLPNVDLITFPDKSVQTINVSHIPLLESDSVYWDLIAFLNCYSGQPKMRSLRAISDHMDRDEASIKSKLEQLIDKGLCFYSDGKFNVAELVSIPQQELYSKIRNQNFDNAFCRFWKSPSDTRFRTVHTRTLTDAQISDLNSLISKFLDRVAYLQETDDGVMTSIGIFYFRRN